MLLILKNRRSSAHVLFIKTKNLMHNVNSLRMRLRQTLRFENLLYCACVQLLRLRLRQ